MTNPTGQEQTAVATTAATPATAAAQGKAAGQLAAAESVKSVTAQGEMMRAVQRALRNTQWGKELALPAVKALTHWCERRGLDCTEVDVLGGNIYINAQFYLRKLAQKAEAGAIEYAYPDHVHVDERLSALATDEMAPQDMRDKARTELYRRMLERTAHNLPDRAKAAVVYRVKLRGMTGEFTGAKAVGNVRGNTSSGRPKDPIGEEFAAETAETRAARRCCRQFIDRFPDLKAEMDMIEAEAKRYSIEVVQPARAEAKAELARPSAMSRLPVRSDGYSDEALGLAELETATTQPASSHPDHPDREAEDAAGDVTQPAVPPAGAPTVGELPMSAEESMRLDQELAARESQQRR